MLKLSLIVMFVLSLATLSFASSFVQPPTMSDGVIPVAPVETHAWIQTFE